MAFTPPQYKDFGKKVSDLFSKGFDFKNELTVISKGTGSAKGIEIESSACSGKSLTGNLKASQKGTKLGADAEINCGTTGNCSAKLTFGNLIPNGKLTTSINQDCNWNNEVAFSQDFFTGLFKFNTNFSGKMGFSAAGAIGYDNVAVGGTVSGSDAGIKDYNCGAEYSNGNLIAAMMTSDQGDNISCSFFQKISKGFSVGTQLAIQSEAGTRTLTVGSDYALDSVTNLKTTANSNGCVKAAVSHVLANPGCKINVSAEFDALSSDVLKANKMGVSFTLGDF
jgi:hypothetical protein